MWKPEQRLAADRSGLRYPSDLTDCEWTIVEPMIPPARHGGRKRSGQIEGAGKDWDRDRTDDYVAMLLGDHLARHHAGVLHGLAGEPVVTA
jgi:hypothetical protein